MGDGEGLEEDTRGQSFQVVELCLPPEVPHLLHVDSALRLSPASAYLASTFKETNLRVRILAFPFSIIKVVLSIRQTFKNRARLKKENLNYGCLVIQLFTLNTVLPFKSFRGSNYWRRIGMCFIFMTFIFLLQR